VKKTVAARALLLAVAGSSSLALFSAIGEAHKGVTSKHTYNADVYPIFASRCAHCHVAGGVGPMSLVSYEEAFPWAESLREELLNTGEGGGDDYVRTAHSSLTASELDGVVRRFR
jgi:cytochrome c553